MTLTKENVKYHCRTCLIKLDMKQGSVLPKTPDGVFVSSMQQEFYFNINTSPDLKTLMCKFLNVQINDMEEDYPQFLCLNCYNQFQSMERFRRLTEETAIKLSILFNIKNEDNSSAVDESFHRAQINHIPFQETLHKDALMETETIIIGDSRNVSDTEFQTDDDPQLAANPPYHHTTPPPAHNSIESDNNTADETEEGTATSVTKRRTRSNANPTPPTRTTAIPSEEEDGDISLRFIDSDISSSQEWEANTSATNKLKKTAVLSKKRKIIENGKRLRKTSQTKIKLASDNDNSREQERSLLLSTEKANSTRRRRQKGSKNLFKCGQCWRGFTSKMTMDAHVRKIHEGSKHPFQCDRCEKRYSFLGGLHTHIKEIHEAEVRSYPCDFGNGCDRVYTSFVAMLRHKKIKHTTDGGAVKTYVCEQCGATFKQSSNLSMHRRKKHPSGDTEKGELNNQKELFECSICKKTFYSRYTLKYHTQQLHTNDTKFECNICGRRLAKKFMLVQHMLVHSTEKTPCEHCGKQFVRKFELDAHIKAVHMKLKPFECRHCNDSFASRKTLRHHEYIHTGEKPYVCDMCGQGFRQQTCLKNHKKIHEKTHIADSNK